MFGKAAGYVEARASKQVIPFVGRETELQYLQQAFETVIATHAPKFILIEGDFGVGKTTLINRFLAQANETHSSILIGRGTCSNETEMNGLLPFGELLENLAQTGSQSKVIPSNWMDFVKNIAPAWISIVPVVGGAVAAGVQTTVELQKALGHSGYRQENVFVQFTNALLKLAEQQPVIVFLDDLQWADVSSLELLAHLARQVKARAILFLCAYRPEAKETSRNADHFNACRVKILRPEIGSELEMHEGIHVAAYLFQRYSRHDLSTKIIADIQTATDGHPLFVSQLFSLWEETGVMVETTDANAQPIWKLSADASAHLTIPANMQVVLEQRLRLMGDELRKIATSASVEGEEFSAQVVAQLAKFAESDVYDPLETLEHRYWLIQEHHTKEFGDTFLDMYRFTHRFFRDYIYSKLDAGKRRNMHRAVGECLETLCCNNLEQIASQLAVHFREARQPKKAAKYALLAAQFEQSRYAWSEGEEWCEFGLKLLENVSVDTEINQLKLDLLKRSGNGYSKSGNFTQAEQNYQTALALAQKIQVKPEQIAELCAELAHIYAQEGFRQKSIKYVEQGQKILSEHEKDIPFGEIHLKLAWQYIANQSRQGNKRIVVESLPRLLEEAKRLHQTDEIEYIIALIHNSLSSALSVLCLYEEAIIHNQKSVALLEKIGEQGLAAGFSVNLANKYKILGKYQEGLALASRAFEIASKVGSLDDMLYAKAKKGTFLLELGKLSQALQELEEAKALMQQSGSGWYTPTLYADLALTYLALKDIPNAYQYGINSLAEAQKTDQEVDRADAFDTLGMVESSRKNWDKAVDYFNQAVSAHEKIGDHRKEAIARCHFADALLRQGKSAEAESLLRQALAVFQELKLEHEIKKAEELLAKVTHIEEATC